MERYTIITNESPGKSLDELYARSVTDTIRSFDVKADCDEDAAIEYILNILGLQYIDDFYDLYDIDEELPSLNSLLKICKERSILKDTQPQVVLIIKNENDVIYRADTSYYLDPFAGESDSVLLDTFRYESSDIRRAVKYLFLDKFGGDSDSIKIGSQRILRKAPLYSISGITDDAFTYLEDVLQDIYDFVLIDIDEGSKGREHLTFNDFFNFFENPYSWCGNPFKDRPTVHERDIHTYKFLDKEACVYMSFLYEEPLSKVLESCHSGEAVDKLLDKDIIVYNYSELPTLLLLQLRGSIEIPSAKLLEFGNFTDELNGRVYTFD